MGSLSDLRARVPVHERREVDVDIGPHLQPPEQEGSVFIRLREPTVDRLYVAIEDTQKLRRRRPLWQPDKVYQCLLLTHCHAAPPAADNRELLAFYEHVAEHNDPLFMLLVSRVYAEFPWIRSIFGAGVEKKDELRLATTGEMVEEPSSDAASSSSTTV